MKSKGLSSVDVRPEIERNFKAEVDDLNASSVQNSAFCTSYLFDENGKNSALWPGTMQSMLDKLSVFDLENYTALSAKEGQVL